MTHIGYSSRGFSVRRENVFHISFFTRPFLPWEMLCCVEITTKVCLVPTQATLSVKKLRQNGELFAVNHNRLNLV